MADQEQKEPRKRGRRPGRPPWVPPNLDVVKGLAMQAMTDEKIAETLGISVRTLYRKKKELSQFRQAIKRGGAEGEAVATGSLFSMVKASNLRPADSAVVPSLSMNTPVGAGAPGSTPYCRQAAQRTGRARNARKSGIRRSAGPCVWRIPLASPKASGATAGIAIEVGGRYRRKRTSWTGREAIEAPA